MRRRMLALALVTLIGTAQETRPTPDTAALGGWVAQLDHDAYDTRTAAMEALRRAGEAARPLLEKASKDLALSLEARGRAEALLRELDTAKPRKAGTDVGPVKPDRLDGEPSSGRSEDSGASGIDIRLPGNGSVSKSVVIGPDGTVEILKDGSGITVTIKDRDGTTSVHTAKDLETFRKEHPEVYEKYKGMGLDGGSARLPSMDWPRGWPFEDPVWRGRFGDPRTPVVDVLRPDGVPQAPKGRQLGVVVEKVPPLLDRHLKLGGVGVVVVEVVPGSLAAKIGLAPDDIIRKVDGTSIGDVDGIRRAMNPGGDVQKDALPSVEILRDGVPMKL
jgi:hypothetical protein